MHMYICNVPPQWLLFFQLSARMVGTALTLLDPREKGGKGREREEGRKEKIE